MAKPVSKTKKIESRPVSKTIKNRTVTDYDYDNLYDFESYQMPHNVQSVPELIHLLESDKSIECEAIVYAVEKGTGKAKPYKLSKDKFIETYKTNKKRTFRESVDFFGADLVPTAGGIGQDYVPLLGGPFNKQLYLYDMLKMMATCFQASTHDPILKTAINLIDDFVLGRGFRVDSDNPAALALWRAFEEVNNLQEQIHQFNRELSIYGEQLVYWLPNNEVNLGYNLPPEQAVARGLLPRVRLLDPSTCWDYITYPEDITRKLAYVFVFPTQYQIYTGMDNGRPVPSTKFVYQQIPADNIDHYKINAVSNEKRGRSDLFPVLGYAKRLRDSVNYSILGLQKSTAWAIDTEIDGAQEDIDAYINSQEAIGPMPPPGSEFVHSTKVKRNYLSNEGASKGGNSQAFEWCFSMICSGLGIPQNYFATHLHGATRATAVVATEPVTKKFEMRQQLIERALKKMASRLFKQFGIDAEIEVTFPDLVTQDRSSKLKDLMLAEQAKWISGKTAANIAAKELNINKYEYDQEQAEIKAEQGEDQAFAAPLTTPGIPAENPSAITSAERKQIKDENGSI